MKLEANVLIVVDAGSGWIEAFASGKRTAGVVIKFLRTVFTRFGVPKTLVSDNGPEFVSAEMLGWLKCQGVITMQSPPYHPRANGLAEYSKGHHEGVCFKAQHKHPKRHYTISSKVPVASSVHRKLKRTISSINLIG